MGRMASLPALHDFCNEVRKAGGGKQIKDLMPSIPGNSNECLIAKNLNFKCSVDQYNSLTRQWAMNLNDEDLAQKIGTKLNLKVHGQFVLLPMGIGRVAEAFDLAKDILDRCCFYQDTENGMNYEYVLDEDLLDRSEKNLLKKFWPYLSGEIRGQYRKPSFV